jgi:hypothetical protein
MPKRLCSLCKEEGHYRKTCPRLLSPGNRQSQKCSYCHEQGHKRQTCPRLRSPQTRTNTCSVCKKEGHKKGSCPKVRSRCNLCKRNGHQDSECQQQNKVGNGRFTGNVAQDYLDVLGFVPQNENTIVEVDQLKQVLSNVPLAPILTHAQAGDCQYSAVRAGLNLTLNLQQMRNQTSDYVEHNFEHSWAPSDRPGAPQNFVAYCQAINGIAYGDHYTLVALSNLFHFNYVVVRPDGSVAQSLFPYRNTIFLAYLPHAQHYILLKVILSTHSFYLITLAFLHVKS